ncbi:MAG: sugar transferase [Candidatus Paceibacter sp.]|jgi:lipopolysaccharide/colanic/teichoic acid biosynthesis glycosyltransferase|nr:sugar transferase [Candidatus Paceibacter sp.]
MTAFDKKDPIILFIGDVLIFVASLWITLLIRYRYFPQEELLRDHLVPFSILFIVWFLVFFIAGLYEKRVVILKNRLPGTIIRVQVVNIILAVLFFYFIPYFGITPKTNLFIYLVISSSLILLWRIYGYGLLGLKGKQNAILIASGEEMKDLREMVNSHNHYNINFISSVDLDKTSSLDFQEEIVKRVYSEDVGIIAIDFKNEKVDPILPALYNLIFSHVVFIDMYKIYEDVFDRIPLSLITYSWFLENISLAPKITYDFLKRIMDVFISAILGVISLIAYPFIIIAIKWEDKGPIIIAQDRVGKNGAIIKIYKFRTMTSNDNGIYSNGKSQNVVTRVGNFLRKTRLDELPQLWNVLHGELSLIGPRPEFPPLVAQYEKEIPYYGIRHLIKPGLSGWAQLYHDNHPHHGVAVEQTKEKLSYDLFYLKNRSFLLDVIIALKTIKKLLSRSGI